MATALAQSPQTPPESGGEADLSGLSLQQLLEVRYETVYSASRRQQKVTEAPASVSIVSSEQIKSFGYRNLAEVFGSVPGTYTIYDRSYHYLGVRGFNRPGDYHSRVLVLVDGVRMNDNLFDSAVLENESMPGLDLIDHVEVVQGSASSLYGSSAFFSTINIVTKTGAQVGGLETSGEYGSYDAYKGRITYGVRTQSEVDLLLSAAYYDTTGQETLYYPEFDRPEENNGVAQHLDFERMQTYFAKVSYRGLKLTGGFTSRTKGDPTGAFGTVFNDSRNRFEDRLAFAGLGYDHEFENGLQLTTQLSWQYSEFSGDYPYANEPPALLPTRLEQEHDRGSWWGGQIQLSREFFERLTLTLGGDWRHNYRQDQLYQIAEEPEPPLLDERRDSLVLGVYSQADLRLRPNLTLSAGVRYDRHDTLGDEVSPRLALIYQPWTHTSLKAIYGEAFRAPNVYEVYAFYPEYQKGNLELSPETIRSYELIWEQKLSPALSLNLSTYHYDVDDLISQVADPDDGLLVYRNAQKVTANGGSLGLQGAWSSGWLLGASYGLQRAEEEGSGQALSVSPLHLLKFNTRIPLWKQHVFVGPDLCYVSEMKTAKGGRSEGYWLANLTFLVRDLPLKRLEFSTSVYNLFDHDYTHPAPVDQRQDLQPQDGTTFRVKLTYRF